MTVLVYSARPYDQSALQMASAGKHELRFTEKSLSMSTAYLADQCQAVALFTSDDASAPVLEKLYAFGVRFILLRSVGYDHIDLAKAEALGIRVANVPEYSPYSVAEHAVAMLMAVNRKLIQGQKQIDLQDFRLDALKGFDIHGKTVGVIGTGKIGLAFARIMLGFGANVLACDPQGNPEAVSLGIKYVSISELLEKSDIVSLHCPLNDTTKHMIGSSQFSLMKQGAVIINTARGALINTTDLIAALENGQLGAACLDVYEFEKGLFFSDHSKEIIHDSNFIKLRSFKNVLITGHQGFLTSNAIDEIAGTTVNNLEDFEKRSKCDNELTRNLENDRKAAFHPILAI
jgi:D-lactate dehydrogenase